MQAAQEREAGLQAQLANLQRSLFGRKSEATPAGGDDPSATAGVADNPPATATPAPEQPASKDPAVRPRRQRGRQPGSPTPPREQRPDLPVVFEWLDVPEQERRCPDCGTAYVACGHKISWLYELAWNALVCKVVRQRYCPDCDCGSARPVSAPPAPRLGTSQLGTSVWAWCLVQVYALFRPQAAVARDLAALGLRVPQSTLSTGLRRLAQLFEPLDAAIGEYQQQPVAQADETSWPVQSEPGKFAGRAGAAAGQRRGAAERRWASVSGLCAAAGGPARGGECVGGPAGARELSHPNGEQSAPTVQSVPATVPGGERPSTWTATYAGFSKSDWCPRRPRVAAWWPPWHPNAYVSLIEP